MTPFNPESKQDLTYREAAAPAMDITDADDAKQYLEAMASFYQIKSGGKPTNIYGQSHKDKAKEDLRYYAARHSDDAMRRVERLFLCL